MLYSISLGNKITPSVAPAKHHSFINAFFLWCTRQDKDHHLAWVGICLLTTTAVLFPLTMTSILLNGAVFSLIIIAMIALVLVVVLNLASMPTRYTLPAFVLGILVDACVIAASFLIS